MGKPQFQKSLSAFRALRESSPLEAPVRGFNRYDRDMNPETRELVLRARMPEIMAFAEDRRLDAAVVAGVVEASMRLGRIPDLGMYGLAGDEALAVKDFVATCMLGLEAELAQGLPQITESHEKHAKHKAYAAHYGKLADYHQKMIEFHTKAASESNKAGKPFTAAQHQGKIQLLKQLHASHAALADYHDCESRRHLAAAQMQAGQQAQQTLQQTGHPAGQAPAPGATPAPAHAKAKVEQTSSAMLSPLMSLTGSAFIKRPGLKPVAAKEKKDDDCDCKNESRNVKFLDDMLVEGKKKEKSSDSLEKALGMKSDPDKVNKTVANAKCAPLFHALGHKLDAAEAKIKRKKKPGTEWTNKLHKTCLSKGGAAAADEVIKASLADSWLRDQGFVDEAANLRAKWQTMMSQETQERAIKDAPTSPEPVVFAINRMIDMASGKGSIY